MPVLALLLLKKQWSENKSFYDCFNDYVSNSETRGVWEENVKVGHSANASRWRWITVLLLVQADGISE